METEKALKILMLEDSMDDVELIERVLRKNNLLFEKECVDTRDEFNAAIRDFKPDVILSDHGLPGFNSREALKISLRERANTPFILVTGSVSDDYAISCLRDGADDYILKSNLARLPMAIRSAVKRRRLEKLKREARYALRRQNDQLLKVNRELDNFVYSVSHNLRGPIASMMGLVNIAASEKDLDSVQPLYAMMTNSLTKLDDTLEEILEYSRNSRHELQVDAIDWNYIIQYALDKLSYRDPGNRIEKNFELHTAIPFWSDSQRIATIFCNVLSNAFLFSSKDRPPKIQVTITTAEDEAKIVISDNGIGIPEDVMPKIYNMFYRGAETSQGAGLGLYIVKEIINKLKGTIEIHSTEGKGTRVTMTLPNLKAAV